MYTYSCIYNSDNNRKELKYDFSNGSLFYPNHAYR